MSELIKLKDAIKLYKQEKDVPSNSYSWYVKHGLDIDGVVVPRMKIKGVWYVDKNVFDKAIQKYREKVELKQKMTDDFNKGIIHGKDGDNIPTNFGYYRIQGDFYFVFSYYAYIKKDSDGTWYCKTCIQRASTEHKKEECHLCRDWNGCGKDCTLSKISCIIFERANSFIHAYYTSDSSFECSFC